MSKCSPFAEKAGMRKVAEQQVVESVSVVAKALSDLGFDLQLLGSECYVTSKLANLTAQQLEKLKEAFGKCVHPRFKKEFVSSRHQPFGKTADYIKNMKSANLRKIAKLIRIVSMINQNKVYLFWQKVRS
ncbi:MAG: hypothetical protein NWE98_10275 [Candidatus Bathyarchaeota archaeon]|nr:hypothetical protein [Candidatus Bathyarchaeota archaeon]